MPNKCKIYAKYLINVKSMSDLHLWKFIDFCDIAYEWYQQIPRLFKVRNI